MTVLAHHAAIEAIALFVPALAVIGVIAGAVILDRRRGAQDDDDTDQVQP
ncbi:MAG: hypothetical protein ABIS86_19580 [Streptosporangiaceae bacterium]